MISKKNMIALEGGLTRDATYGVDGKIVELSLAVDNSGSEKGVQFSPGYFDCKCWLTDSEYSPAALGKAVKKYMDEGDLVKGARISVVGRLVQERWVGQDGKKSSKNVVMIESLDCYRKAGAPAGSVAQASSASAPSDIDSF